MKNPKNELLQFVAGLVMLVVGLYIFSQKVIVVSTMFNGRVPIVGYHVNSGLIIIPLIIGIIWMFVSSASFGSKIMTAIGVLIIVVSVIMSTSIRLVTMTLYEWVLILVLIFGGVGFVAKILFFSGDDNVSTKKKNKSSNNSSEYDIDSEIEKIKKNNKL